MTGRLTTVIKMISRFWTVGKNVGVKEQNRRFRMMKVLDKGCEKDILSIIGENESILTSGIATRDFINLFMMIAHRERDKFF